MPLPLSFTGLSLQAQSLLLSVLLGAHRQLHELSQVLLFVLQLLLQLGEGALQSLNVVGQLLHFLIGSLHSRHYLTFEIGSLDPLGSLGHLEQVGLHVHLPAGRLVLEWHVGDHPVVVRAVAWSLATRSLSGASLDRGAEERRHLSAGQEGFISSELVSILARTAERCSDSAVVVAFALQWLLRRWHLELLLDFLELRLVEVVGARFLHTEPHVCRRLSVSSFLRCTLVRGNSNSWLDSWTRVEGLQVSELANGHFHFVSSLVDEEFLSIHDLLPGRSDPRISAVPLHLGNEIRLEDLLHSKVFQPVLQVQRWLQLVFVDRLVQCPGEVFGRLQQKFGVLAIRLEVEPIFAERDVLLLNLLYHSILNYQALNSKIKL